LSGLSPRRKLIKHFLIDVGGKALSPDGMTMAFLQSNWNAIKMEVTRMFSEFFSSGKFGTSLNATFIGLRNVTLDRYIYKLLSKVLVHRLERSHWGSYFKEPECLVGEHQILDAMLLANELID